MPPRKRNLDDKLAYSSNNYLISTGTTNINVNNNKIGIKYHIKILHNSSKIPTFATDKGTFVLLTIKKVKICLI